MVTFDEVHEYPKFYDDGGVEIAKGLYTNLQGLQEFEDAFLDELKNHPNND